VSHLVRPRLGTTDAIAPKLSPDLRADLLSIDVDGMIDRDLAYFYDFVEPGGIIVLDDYSDFIDGPSASRAAHIRVQSEAEIRAWIDKDRAFNARRLLGKKLLTYRLANYFAFVGAMTFERTIGRTGRPLYSARLRTGRSLPLAYPASRASSRVSSRIS
jgi:hypothetical protein